MSVFRQILAVLCCFSSRPQVDPDVNQPVELSTSKPAAVLAATESSIIRSPLLKLPRELRDKILAYHLVHSTAVYWSPISDRAILGSDKLDNHHFAILCASKQLYEEAMTIYYGRNVFSFYHISAMMKFLSDIGSNGRRFVKHIQFTLRVFKTGDTSLNDKAMEMLAQCESLRSLTINLLGTFEQSIMSSRSLLEADGIKTLRRMRGLQEVKLNPVRGCPCGSKMNGDEYSAQRLRVKELRDVLQEELCREKGSEVEKIEEEVCREKGSEVGKVQEGVEKKGMWVGWGKLGWRRGITLTAEKQIR